MARSGTTRQSQVGNRSDRRPSREPALLMMACSLGATGPRRRYYCQGMLAFVELGGIVVEQLERVSGGNIESYG